MDRAIKSTTDNPELYYLKGQILSSQGKKQNNSSILQEAVKNFDLAIAKKDRLPATLVKQIEREREKAARRINMAQNRT